ncbi:MAG: hypothetical protein KGO02_08485, partial [Alphaproteobacteria bacterium]|nr:hypothetical protein [Alphaproteobacteria bacterium]
YRFNAVQDWLTQKGLSVSSMLTQVRQIEHMFLAALPAHGRITRSQLLVPDETKRGRFLAFRTPDAAAITAELLRRDIIVDYRADRLRIGFGIYHDPADACALAATLAS